MSIKVIAMRCAAGVPAQLVAAGVEADRSQPCPDVVGAAPAPGGVGAQVGVLHDVGRIRRVRREPGGQGMQQVGVAQRRLEELRPNNQQRFTAGLREGCG
jgi:hypothetical protein